MRIGSLISLTAAIGLVAVGAPGLPTGQAKAASFNCAEAASKTEIAICADPNLSQLDSAVGLYYAQRLALDASLRQIQRGWLKARDIGCGRDRDCLRRFMTAEIGWLRGGDPPSALPRSVGVCALTTISRRGSRLQGDPGSGSAIEEANGAMQISYDQIPQIDASRRGDPVMVCLASVPRDCPPGDDRGKVYAVANLRTLGAWAQPDSEHGCGGA
ncbi:MAG TPA: lysozyme inhibitor LprI family protein [Caulobacteraceae bacterium]|jgi:uncharacterized protein YecT (DUF1311 family)